MTEYGALVAELKALSQEDVTLQMAEDSWDTRPNTDSYGLISLDFEAASLDGDSVKQDEAFEGSVDLFSCKRSGEGWIPLIRAALTKHCGASWRLNSRQYEHETNLHHWEWVFQITEAEVPEEPAQTQETTESDG